MSKTIRRIIVAVMCAMILVAAILVPVCSYAAYKSSIKVTPEQTPPVTATDPDDPSEDSERVMTGITAALAEGVAFYKGGLANVDMGDLVVKAEYSDGTEEIIPSDDDALLYSLPEDFRTAGGKITVRYKAFSTSLDVKLGEVAVQRLEVTRRPDKVVYAVSEQFDTSGLELTAVYNTGREDAIDASECTVVTAGDTATTGEKTYELSYGGATVAVDYEVENTVNNGTPVRLLLADNATVEAGASLSESDIPLVLEYANGNWKSLARGEYTVNATDESAVFGVPYVVNVSAEGLSIDAPVSVVDVIDAMDTDRITIEGSNVDGAVPAYTSVRVYEPDGDGKLVATDKYINLISGLDRGFTTTGDGKSSVTFHVTTNGAVKADLDLLAGNNYLSIEWGKSRVLNAMQLNAICTLTVNGREVDIPDSVYHKGYDVVQPDEGESQFTSLLDDMVIRGVPLDEGENEIKFSFRLDPNGYKAAWDNSYIVPSIKSVSITPRADAVDDTATLESLRIASLSAVPGERIAITTIGKYSDGSEFTLPESEYECVVTDEDGPVADGEVIMPDKSYTVTVTSHEVSATKSFTAEDIVSLSITNDDPLLYYDSLSERADSLVVSGVTTSGKTVTLAREAYTVKAYANGSEVEITPTARVSYGASWELVVEYTGDPSVRDAITESGTIDRIQTENERSKTQFAEYLTLGAYFKLQTENSPYPGEYRQKIISAGYEAVKGEDGQYHATDTRVYALSGFSYNDGYDSYDKYEEGKDVRDARYFDIKLIVAESGTYTVNMRCAGTQRSEGVSDAVNEVKIDWNGTIQGSLLEGDEVLYNPVSLLKSGTVISEAVSAAQIDRTNAVSDFSSADYTLNIFNVFRTDLTVELEAGVEYTLRISAPNEMWRYIPGVSFDWFSLEKVS